MRHDYQKLIKESVEELAEQERKHRHSVIGSRLQMLRLLKSGEASSVQQASTLLGYSWRQCQRWLTQYQTDGFGALLTPPKTRGRSQERMTPQAWEALSEAMRQGEIGTYSQARDFLVKQGVVYKDDTSIHRLFKRHKIKAKAGRYRHEKADAEEQEVFKKNLLNS
jgi:transposase